MFKLKVKNSGSWLDPEAARGLAAKLGRRLWERCEGHRGLFLTLTYDRNRYNSPQELYRKQSEEQHVPLFLRKVARRLEQDLAGKWFCKLEFQRGGWVHWHIIILDVEEIPHDVATELWGKGHVWLKRLNKENVLYACKYAVKAAEAPAWLYGEKPRSVKIVRVSSGFWTGERPKQRKTAEPDPYDKYGPVDRGKIDGYVPIGTKLERPGANIVAEDSDGNLVYGRCDPALLVWTLLEWGVPCIYDRQGWLIFEGELRDLRRALHKLAEENERGGQLHLSARSNPDVDNPQAFRERLPKWIDRWFYQDATAQWEGSA